jgi:hypothetical protein
LIVINYFCGDLLSIKQRYICGARGKQIQHVSFLFAIDYFARLSESSDLISFSYEAATKPVGVSSHRNFIILFHEDLVTVSLILCPRAVQVKRTGGTVEQ